ncbi:MAG: cystathionine gamma-synthase [Candidatus Dormibacteria bacterium]
MSEDGRGFSTRAIHVGQGPDLETGAVVQPIHLATTYKQDGIGQHRGYEYSRSGNPTRAALEECLASLEAAGHALAFASGLAATTTLMALFEPGDHVVFSEDIYGGTFRLFMQVFGRYGLRFSTVDVRDRGAVEAALTPSTRLLWLESPTNPLLRLADIAALSELARGRGVTVCVDNTFASPYLQRPLELGADLVMHSATKYLGGHSDVVGGALMTRSAELAERLRFHQNALGAVPSPFDCWLLLRGLKTLAIRMERHCQNALAVAEFLAAHPAVSAVNYPGLPSHPQYQLAGRQMSTPGGVPAFGGMVSFEVDDNAAPRLLAALRVFTLAESLGAVESLAEHPGRMTHASIPLDVRRATGLGDGLIRLSVGIEDRTDLLADLGQALEAATR